MKITENTINHFENETNLHLCFSQDKWGESLTYREFTRKHRSVESAVIIAIYGFRKDGGYIYKEYPAPKVKEITMDWLMGKLIANANKSYQSLRKVFAKVLPDESSRFYVASYGVGFDTFCLTDKRVKECTKCLADLLAKNGIQYRNEYSDANWVYRFVISQSSSNINKINALN